MVGVVTAICAAEADLGVSDGDVVVSVVRQGAVLHVVAAVRVPRAEDRVAPAAPAAAHSTMQCSRASSCVT